MTAPEAIAVFSPCWILWAPGECITLRRAPDSFISGAGMLQQGSNKPSCNTPDENPSNSYFSQSFHNVTETQGSFSYCRSSPFLLNQSAQYAYCSLAQSCHDTHASNLLSAFMPTVGEGSSIFQNICNSDGMDTFHSPVQGWASCLPFTCLFCT